MRRSGTRLTLAGASLLAMAAPACAFAQLFPSLAGAVTTAPLAEAPGDPTTVDEVVVTAAPFAVAVDAMTANVDTIQQDELDVAAGQGVGDLLSGLPGLRSSSFSPGASRPVIRGVSGPRVQVLTNGVGAIDASALSPDHQVATDPAEATQIEVLRGASTLQYGGAAIGGVVNILDERVPSAPATGPLDGHLSAQASSVDAGVQVSASAKTGEGPWVFTADGLRRTTDDYDIPAPAVSARRAAVTGEPRDDAGTLVNSASELTQYGAGLSYITGLGFAGASIKRTESDYGTVAEADVTIQLKQTRVDLRGELDVPLGPFVKTKLSAGFAEYEHIEFEGAEPGTTFLSEGFEARLDLVQREVGDLKGSLGLQALKRDFAAVGAEAYVPSTEIAEVGIYTLQRYDTGGWGAEGGLRLDSRSLTTARGERDFTNVSASAGLFARPLDGLFLGLSLSRAQRAPKEEELFAEGPHVGTNAFEVGDPDIGRETANSVEATAHYKRDRFEADVHAFHVDYDGFIDFRPTGEVRDELPVFVYVQTNARYTGAEIEAGYTAFEDGARTLRLEAAYDTVRAESDLGPLPRIPPWSLTGRLVFEGERTNARVELRRVGEQDDVADFELPTDGYTLLNVFASYKLAGDAVTLFAEGRNLTDEEAREHASFLKDIAPMPGRNFRAGVAYRF